MKSFQCIDAYCMLCYMLQDGQPIPGITERWAVPSRHMPENSSQRNLFHAWRLDKATQAATTILLSLNE
jgi:hypothetical protein